MTTPTLIYPSLAGLDIGIEKSVQWSTIVQKASSGRESRIALWTYPLYSFKLPYAFLRAKASLLELQTLLGFINQAQGSFQPFLYTDASDNSINAFQIGTGDGSNKVFQLARSLGGAVEPTYWINGAPTMSPATPFTLGANGRITYTTAPGVGVPVLASFSYYYGCRFAKDGQAFKQFFNRFWQSSNDVEFVGGLQDKLT